MPVGLRPSTTVEAPDDVTGGPAMSEELADLVRPATTQQPTLPSWMRTGASEGRVRGPGASPCRARNLPLSPGEVIDQAWIAAGVATRPARAAVGVYFLAAAQLRLRPRPRVIQAIEARGWSACSTATTCSGALGGERQRERGVASFIGAGINCVGRLKSDARARFACLGPLSVRLGRRPLPGNRRHLRRRPRRGRS